MKQLLTGAAAAGLAALATGLVNWGLEVAKDRVKKSSDDGKAPEKSCGST